jgi:hypothetical protein
MKKRLPFALGLTALIALGCLAQQNDPSKTAPEGAFPKIVASRRTLTERGGRVDWCPSTNMIAFDRLTGANICEVYVIRPDGSKIAVYYATFGRGAVTQTIDILELNQAY